MMVRKEYAKESANTSVSGQSKQQLSWVPKLIDNKRKHLEWDSSATQRDQLLLEEAKEDSKFKRNLAAVMHK